MSELETSYKSLPMDENVVIKLPKGVQIQTVSTANVFHGNDFSTYTSTKGFEDRMMTPIRGHIKPAELLNQGIKAEILEPGKKWITGNIRFRFVIEFIPDKPEITTESSLDDIRKAPMNGY